MNFLLELLNELSNINFDNVKTLDLTKEEDNKKFKAAIKFIKNYKKEAENNSLMTLFSNLFDDEFLNEAENFADKSLKESQKKEQKPAQVTHLIEDKSQEIKRPSQHISTEAGLQIHKLVQEYIDTMIKPYNPKVGGLTTKQINDAYAGLYEFAAWLYNK